MLWEGIAPANFLKKTAALLQFPGPFPGLNKGILHAVHAFGLAECIVETRMGTQHDIRGDLL